MAVDFYTIQIS